MGKEKPSQPKLPNAEDNVVITIKKAKKQEVKLAPKKIVKPTNQKEKQESPPLKTNHYKLSEQEKSYFSYFKQDEDRLIDIAGLYNQVSH